MPRHLMVKRGGDSPEEPIMNSDDSPGQSPLHFFGNVGENFRFMKKSPKKRLFPSEVQTSSKITDENACFGLESQHPQNSIFPIEQSEDMANRKVTNTENTPRQNNIKSPRSMAISGASDENYQNSQSTSGTRNVSKTSSCSYKILGVKKKFLLRSGMASFPVCNELKNSPKRLPLSPVKANTYCITTSSIEQNKNVKFEHSIDKPSNNRVLFTHTAQLETVSDKLFSPNLSRNCATKIMTSETGISLDCGQVGISSSSSSSPPVKAPQYSPISSASESSNLSDVADVGSSPSTTSSCSSSPDDVIHYTVRTLSTAGPGTKLTLVRQTRLTGGEVAISSVSRSSDPQATDTILDAVSNFPDFPVDMSLKSSQRSTLSPSQTVTSQTSLQKRLQETRHEKTSGPTSPLPHKLDHTDANLGDDDKENIPPFVHKMSSSTCSTYPSLLTRTYTPEPISCHLHQGKKKPSCERLQLSRPSTAPPTIAGENVAPHLLDGLAAEKFRARIRYSDSSTTGSSDIECGVKAEKTFAEVEPKSAITVLNQAGKSREVGTRLANDDGENSDDRTDAGEAADGK
ncbi:hypothetical protein PoB_001049100 [Plakobranchus ocellatus]|uniref:WASP family protein member n=1 Tax=Plakobranchus ocellatus TaxID=259542 RepID=A0AAV3YL15_9GAST|nr:hypothetical protein PoB_001049100 [Plakobranchus ocellatus]